MLTHSLRKNQFNEAAFSRTLVGLRLRSRFAGDKMEIATTGGTADVIQFLVHNLDWVVAVRAATMHG